MGDGGGAVSCDYYICGVERPIRLNYTMSHQGPPGPWFWGTTTYDPIPVARMVEVVCQCGHTTDLRDGYDLEGVCPGCWERWGPKATIQYEAAQWWVPVVLWLGSHAVESVRTCTEYIDDDGWPQDWPQTAPAWWTDTKWVDFDSIDLDRDP